MATLWCRLVLPRPVLLLAFITVINGLYYDDVSSEEYSPYLATIMPQLAQYDIPELDEVYFTSPVEDRLDLVDDGRLERLQRQMRSRRHLMRRYHNRHHHHHHHHHHPQSQSHSRYAERLRRQAELEGGSVETAKAKLQHALQAAKALGGIEKEMGLDPNYIEEKTAHIKDDLTKEEQKYKEEELSDDIDADKRAKLKKYSEFAKKDMKEADSILSLIVKLEAAKYLAAERAREEVQKAQRNQIQASPWAPSAGPYSSTPYQSPYQAPYMSQTHMGPSPLSPQSSFSPQMGSYLGPLSDQPVSYLNPMQGSMFSQKSGPLFPGSSGVAAYTSNEGPVEDKTGDLKEPPKVSSSFSDSQLPVFSNDASSSTTDSTPIGLAPLEPIISESGPLISQTPSTIENPAAKHGIKKPSVSKLQKGLTARPAPAVTATTSKSSAKQIVNEGVQRTDGITEQPNLVNAFSSQSAPLTVSKPSNAAQLNFAPPVRTFSPPQMQRWSQPFSQKSFNMPPPAAAVQRNFQTNPLVRPAFPKHESANLKSAFETRPLPSQQSPLPAATPMVNAFVGYQPGQRQTQQSYMQYQQENFAPYQSQPLEAQSSYYWPQQASPAPLAQPAQQVPQPSYTGYSGFPSFQQPLDPKVVNAQEKVQNVKKASIAVNNLEQQIGLTPGTVNNLIDNVEKNAKEEMQHYEKDMAREKSEIQSEKKLIQNDQIDGDMATIQNQIADHEKKLDDDKQKEQAAERKLNEIKQIEKILTVIEAAKFSALQRAKTRLQELDTQKDILRIRKRDLEEESGVTDLKRNRRNEINIFLHGSRNKIDASHLVERKKIFNQHFKKRIKSKLNKNTKHNTVNSFGLKVGAQGEKSGAFSPADTQKTVSFPPADAQPSSHFAAKKSQVKKKKSRTLAHMEKEMNAIKKLVRRLLSTNDKIMAKVGKKEKEKLRVNSLLEGSEEKSEKKRSVRATTMRENVQETLDE